MAQASRDEDWAALQAHGRRRIRTIRTMVGLHAGKGILRIVRIVRADRTLAAFTNPASQASVALLAGRRCPPAEWSGLISALECCIRAGRLACEDSGMRATSPASP